MSSQLQPQTDLDFRPASYWDLSDPVTVVLSAIAGQHRRSLARSVLTGLAAGELPDPGYLPEELFAERLDDHRRASFTAIRAALTFGEYLPALAEGSVEIARLAFTLKDEGNVLSIRAFRDVGRFIRYCVVDEHETQFTLNAPRSKRPLTLEELASLVESIRPTSSAIAAAWNERADEFKDMRMTVDSPFYPGLAALFDERVHALPMPPTEPATDVDYLDLVWGETRHSIVIIPRGLAHDLARTQKACRHAKTWGEFRAQAPYWAYLQQFQWVDGWDQKNDCPLNDASPFHPQGGRTVTFLTGPSRKC